MMEMGSASDDRQLLYFNDDGHARMFVQDPIYGTHIAISDASSWADQWYYFVGTWNASWVRLFVNGVEDSTPVVGDTGISTSTSCALGAAGLSSGNWFNGGLDELRISTVVRNNSWIATEYAMMNDPGNFTDVGPVEFLDAPVVSDVSPENGSSDVSLGLSALGFMLTDFQNDAMEYWVETVPDIGSAHDTMSSNGVVSVSVSGLVGDTGYVWFVNVTDGSNATNRSFSFTTESDLPLILNESPADGSIDVPLNPTLQAEIIDLQGESVEWQILFYDTGSSSWTVLNSGTLPTGSGSVSVVTSDADTYGVLYVWSVNVTESGSSVWVNQSFSFSTPPLLSDWQYRKKITVDHTMVTDDHVGFPVLVDISGDSSLAAHARSDAGSC